MEHIKHLSLGWLVMAAALLFAGCSSEDDTIAGEPKTTEPTAQATVIRVTVGAGIDPTPDPSPTGAGSSATTRSTVDYTGGTRTLQFTTGDKLYVWGGYGDARYEPSGAIYYDYIVAGYLDLDAKSFEASDPTNATFTGELTVYQWINEQGHTEQYDEYVEEQGEWRETYDDDGNLISSDWVITVEPHTETKEIWVVDTDGYYKPTSSSGIFSTADPLGECSDVTGTLIHEGAVEGVDYTIFGSDRHVSYSISCAATVEALMTKELEVKGDYNAGSKSFSLAVETRQAILNFTFSGLTAGATYQVDYRYGYMAAMEYTRSLVSSSSPLTATGGTLSFACFAIVGDNFYHGIRLTNTADAGDVAELSLGKMSFTNMVYNVSRKWTGSAFVKYVNLTGQTGDVTVKDGYTVEGTLSGHQLLIADGATVTLNGASVTGPEGTGYGAIRCLGDATIILTDGTTNTALSGLGNKYAAVSVPEGKTLTINGGSAGTGTLTADARVEGDGNSRAGIGGGAGISCGKITITGGTVTAYGNNSAAGIGGGYDAYFDDISISGGTVTATGGQNSEGGAGIGCHAKGSGIVGTGSITISGGTVTATGGGKAAGIGTGENGKCGNISIEGGNVTATGYSGGAGIGSGYASDATASCGTITIGSGIISVTATKGADGYAEYLDIRCIGKGKQGTAGTVKIDGQTITDDMFMKEPGVDVFANDFDSDEDYNDYVLDYNDSHQDLPTFPNITLDGDKYSQTWTLTHK